LDVKTENPITELILAWYARHQRDLPWRQTRNPYFIWVAEVMLQQTRVETVIPYYHRFLSEFPTIKVLAGASLQGVLKVWENLGYYGRARHLHEAAKEIKARMGGRIPKTFDELLALPGIGSYTAGAILSFAFGQRVPAVDGNVRRVLCRLFSIQEPIDRSLTQRQVFDLAAELIPMKNSSYFNQGLMDLGATICTPRKPSCGLCPVQALCLASQRRLQEALPVTRKRGPLPHKQMTAGIIDDDQGRLLIVQRPNKGLLGGLWKFPGGERIPGETLDNSLQRVVKEELGIRVKVEEAVTSVRHAYTHFRITLYAFRCLLRVGRPRALSCSRCQWVESHKLANFPFSKADRKIMIAL